MAQNVVIENASFKAGFKLAAGGFLFGLCIAIPLALVTVALGRVQPAVAAVAEAAEAEAAVDFRMKGKSLDYF